MAAVTVARVLTKTALATMTRRTLPERIGRIVSICCEPPINAEPDTGADAGKSSASPE